MILSLGSGDTSYVPDSLAGMPHDQVEWDMVAFAQCYARSQAAWEILIYYSTNEGWSSTSEIASAVQLPEREIARRLTELVNTGMFQERVLVTGPLYRLSNHPQVRRVVKHLGVNAGAVISQ